MARERLAAPPSDPVSAILEPSLKVGLACGAGGFLFGGAAGIVKGTAPFLFASASGLQTFALGTTFWGIRSGVLQAWTPKHDTPRNLVQASTISGGITGATVALITRGRSNVIPGALMFSVFGFLGQTMANGYSATREATPEPKEGFWKRMSEKPWSPVKIMSNEEYADMLREKMLRVDAEMAVIDDKIAALKEEQKLSESISALSSAESGK